MAAPISGTWSSAAGALHVRTPTFGLFCGPAASAELGGSPVTHGRGPQALPCLRLVSRGRCPVIFCLQNVGAFWLHQQYMAAQSSRHAVPSMACIVPDTERWAQAVCEALHTRIAPSRSQIVANGGAPLQNPGARVAVVDISIPSCCARGNPPWRERALPRMATRPLYSTTYIFIPR